MILPNVVHSFYLGKDSDCEFQQIHFRPETFANVILDNSGIYPISMMHAIHFHFKTYYHQKSDSVLDDCLQKVIDLHASSDSLFSAPYPGQEAAGSPFCGSKYPEQLCGIYSGSHP